MMADERWMVGDEERAVFGAPLSAEARGRLRAALAARPRGLFTDVDGTISAIAPTPETAVLLPGAREALEEACARFDVVATVSGRAALDARRLVGVDGLLSIGNHGLEWLEPATPDAATPDAAAPEPRAHAEAAAYMERIAAALAELEARLGPALAGLRVEPKGVTGSAHVRNTADPAAAEERVYAEAVALAGRYGLRVTRGKLVVELRPPVAMEKGLAVEAVIRERGLRGALYLGDDRTDIDAFRALRRLTAAGVCEGVGVGVLQADAPAQLAEEADVTLAGVERVVGFLRWALAQ